MQPQEIRLAYLTYLTWVNLGFKGPDALNYLEYLSPSKVSKLEEGESCYSFFTNESAGVVDDLLIYCFKKNEDYLICVNASNTDKVEKHINKYNKDFNVEISNECEIWGPGCCSRA